MLRFNWKSIGYQVCLGLNCLLLFLALFGTQLKLPGLLQVAGRAHPLVLHFPIVLIILSAIWEWRSTNTQNVDHQSIGDTLLLVSAVSAALSALLGLFLSNEGGYEEHLLVWHRWSGITLSLICWCWLLFRSQIRDWKYGTASLATVSMVVLLLAGHKGAALTHGENYLLAPITTEPTSQPVNPDSAQVFEHVVRPILKEKCMNCHNSGKTKGGLNMETEASLLIGGKNGVLWDPNAPDMGLLLRRLHLPLDEKEHMPPKDKMQLSELEIAVLQQWIKNGAHFHQKLSELPANDSLKYWANQWLRGQFTEAPTYPFAPADEALIRKLNNNYRVVRPLALGSPALSVEFFGATTFESESLKELEPLKTQITDLSLHKMPVQDQDLKMLATFPNLRSLNLAFTQITGAGLSVLSGLKTLESLSLSGTSVKAADLSILRQLPALRRLFLWNTPISAQEMNELRKAYTGLQIEAGFDGQGVIARLNAPVIEGGEAVFGGSTRVSLKNFIQGAELRYTLDGSTPDSLGSSLYTGDSITIDKSCQLNARAFLKGWISSEAASRSFYKTGIKPDSVILRFPPNPQYKGEGVWTLFNQKIGDTDFRTNKWTAYRESALEALLLFHQPVKISSVSFSTLVDIGSFIMPAAELQVWGGNDAAHLKLLKTLHPEQPEKIGTPAYRSGYNCEFNPLNVKVLKIVARPLKKLPSWHPGKGEPAWVFLDELFLN